MKKTKGSKEGRMTEDAMSRSIVLVGTDDDDDKTLRSYIYIHTYISNPFGVTQLQLDFGRRCAGVLFSSTDQKLQQAHEPSQSPSMHHARLLHQIMRRPGRGGLSAKGAAQLRRYFSKRATEAGKLSLGDMDESAGMVMLCKWLQKALILWSSAMGS